MGLLDSVMGVLGKAGGKGGGKDVMSQLSTMLTGKGGDGQGLSRLIEQFKGAGLGDKAASWIGKGDNQPLAPDEVEKAIGPDRLATMSKQTGQSVGSLKDQLAKMIPEAVNKLTPNGKLPNPGELMNMVKGLDLGKLFGGK
jgi:uncharacterized protein YidB (DUF937 family)